MIRSHGVDSMARGLRAAMGERAPDVTVVVPTLNAMRVLSQCLESIVQQRTNLELELLVVDAGSTDGSRAIAERYGARLLENPGRTGEAGKAIGLSAARGELVAFIDSDNVLVEDRWFDQMVAPFREPDIVASEPENYIARRSDGYLTRYFAHLGMADPLCLFLGNYDRYCALTGRWTDVPVRAEPRPGYDKVWLRPDQVPTIGANGFIIRRQVLSGLRMGDYLADVDVVDRLLDLEHWAFAKVHCGIVHLVAGSVQTFRRKQRRRIRDFLYYRRRGVRTRNPAMGNRRGLARFIIATMLGWPLAWQAFQGLRKTRDPAWLFHPAACALTLFEYASGVAASRWQTGSAERANWSQ